MMLATPETPKTRPPIWWARMPTMTDAVISTTVSVCHGWAPPALRGTVISPYSVLVLATGLMRAGAR